MAFAGLSNAQTAWYLANRHGGVPNGTPGTALGQDLLVGDYLVGSRMVVTALGGTTSGVKTITCLRAGVSVNIGVLTAVSMIIIRP